MSTYLKMYTQLVIVLVLCARGKVDVKLFGFWVVLYFFLIEIFNEHSYVTKIITLAILIPSRNYSEYYNTNKRDHNVYQEVD